MRIAKRMRSRIGARGGFELSHFDGACPEFINGLSVSGFYHPHPNLPGEGM